MPDALGPRLKIGAITPATNTIVQPEFDAMRPPGISNQLTRVVIPDTPVDTEEEFARMMSTVRTSVETAIDTVMACAPATVIMAMTAETFWEGTMDVAALQTHLESRAHVKVILGQLACQAAMQRYGGIRRISIITPYMPAGDAQVRRSFTDIGFEVVNLLGLKSNSPLLMAHESPERLRSIRDEMLAITSKDFWEVVDRGTNFDYLSDERKEKLREFFDGFASLSAPAPAAE